MGNLKLEQCGFQINTTSPIMLKATVVETWRQHARARVTQSLNACITTTRVETVVVPNIDVVRRGILIGFIVKLGSISNRVLARRNLS
jgi:hypothetical protein